MRMIKHYLNEGNYRQVLDEIEKPENSEIEILKYYKMLILCLSGRIIEGFKYIETFKQTNGPDKFSFLTLKLCLFSFQGNEIAVKRLFEEGLALLSSYSEEEKNTIKEWIAWFYWGNGAIEVFNLNFEKPYDSYINKSLEIFNELGIHHGILWNLYFIYFAYMDRAFYGYVDRNIAKSYFKKVLEINQINPTNFSQVCSLLLKATEKYFKGNEKELSLNLVDRAINLCNLSGLQFFYIHSIHLRALIHHFSGDIVLAEENYAKSILLGKNLGFLFFASYAMFGTFYLQKGDYESALSLCMDYLEDLIQNSNMTVKSKMEAQISLLYYSKGDISNAYLWTNKSIETARQINYHYLQAESLTRMAFFKYEEGFLNEALELYEIGLNTLDHLSNTTTLIGGKYPLTSFILQDLAEIYSIQGEMEKALQLIEEAILPLIKYESFFFGIVNLYISKGIILLKSKDFLSAINVFIHCLEIINRFNNPLFKAKPLYYLVLTNVELGQIKEAENYTNELEAVSKLSENLLINQRVKISKGLIYKNNPRAAHKVKAQEIFNSIITEEIISQEISTFASLMLLELLVWELSSTGYEDVLMEINQIIGKLKEISTKYKSYSLEIDMALIQSQIELLNGNFDNSNSILDEALMNASKHNLQNHKERIENEKIKISNELSKWKKLTEENATLIDKMQHTQLTSYIQSAREFIDTGLSSKERFSS